MRDIEKYSYLRMDITLNRKGYGYEDMNCLFEEPFSSLYPTKIGFEWHPSAVGDDLIDLRLIFNFVLSGAATAIVGKIAIDLYDWSKKALKNVLRKKNSFDDSRITLVFNNVIVTISTNRREDILITISNIDTIIEYFKNSNIEKDCLDIDFEELCSLVELTRD